MLWTWRHERDDEEERDNDERDDEEERDDDERDDEEERDDDERDDDERDDEERSARRQVVLFGDSGRPLPSSTLLPVDSATRATLVRVVL